MQRSLSELKEECKSLGLEVKITGKKEGKKDYVQALQKFFLLKKERTFGLNYRLTLESPQLCFLSNHLRGDEIKKIYESDKWVFEEKINGVRMIISYHPDQGFEFFSRNLSLEDYCPVDYTSKVYLGEGTYKGYGKSFVLDAELISRDSRISTILGKRGVITETILQAVTALLALNSEDSIRIQKELNKPFQMHAFDCLYYDGQDLRKLPYKERRIYLNEVMTFLENLGLNFYKVKAVRNGKKEYLDCIWENKGEGCVAKRIDMSYLDRDSRPRDGWVKFKRTVSGALGDTVDGYISGFELGDPEKGYQNLVGALCVSVMMEKNDGSCKEHMIAKVPNIPLELRQKMTIIENGKPVLDRSFYNRVVEVEGQAISARAKRLTHPRLVRFRDDKNIEECVIKEEDLLRLIL